MNNEKHILNLESHCRLNVPHEHRSLRKEKCRF
jgi:hypothetical protein